MDSPPGWPPLRLRLANAVTYVLLIIVNVATQTGLLGDDNATISARFPTLLTPAGWAFSVWGIIFLLQGVGVVYQLLPYGYNGDGEKARIINTIGYSWVAGWVFEIAWQAFFQLQSPLGMWICLALILGAFVSFGRALLRLYGLKQSQGPLHSVLLFASYWLPTSINTAWLSVASSVAALVVPAAYGHTGRGTELVAVTLAALFTVVGMTAMIREKDVVYGLTLVWSLAAVFGGQDAVMVRVAALVCIVALLAVALASVLRRNSGQQAGVEGSVTANEVRQALMTAESPRMS